MAAKPVIQPGRTAIRVPFTRRCCKRSKPIDMQYESSDNPMAALMRSRFKSMTPRKRMPKKRRTKKNKY